MMSASTSKEKKTPKLDWMYQGPSGNINREEYLLGRKVDKNYEQHAGDLLKTDAPNRFDVLSTTSTLRSVAADDDDKMILGLETVKKEDPLVQIKVQEEKLRREIVANPIKMKRLQKFVMEAMEKKVKKQLKKEYKRAKKHKHKRRDSSSESSDEDSRTKRRQNDRAMMEPRRQRADSSSEDERDRRGQGSKKEEVKKEVVKRQRSPSCSDSDEERRRKRFSGYGLVNVKREPLASTATSESTAQQQRAAGMSSESRRDVSASAKETKKQRSPPRRRLTAAEIEERRREMTDNAKWREQQRGKNLNKYARLEKEEAETEKTKSGGAGDFIRSMLNDAAETSTVAERVKSNVQKVQRNPGAMDRNFARR